jgi:3-deoxy-D-manno-octulosonate 8-phosphate phosphatase (KDO 8-P phosphatase)
MLSSSEVIRVFEDHGADILASENDLKNKFRNIKGILLDWDGVFNDGLKGDGASNTFSEVDAMGLNLLRFGLWDRLKQMPGAFIISGLYNNSAFQFAQRESFNAVYLDVKDKSKALQHINNTYRIKPSELICIFDDVLDLAMAKDCGLRFLVSRKSNPLFIEYVKSKKWCDYITANSTGANPIREVCEFLLGVVDSYERILDNRISFSATYSSYWNERKNTTAKRFSSKDGLMVETQ